MTPRPIPGSRPHRLFWTVCDLVQEKRSAKGWSPGEVSFERSVGFKSAGRRWKTLCSIEFGFLGGAEAHVHLSTAQLPVRKRLMPRSPEFAFFDAFARGMRTRGYEGEWDLGCARGPTAFFRKPLRSPAAIRREWERLDHFRPEGGA